MKFEDILKVYQERHDSGNFRLTIGVSISIS